MENIIEIKGLKKSFGDKEVLKNIELTVSKGENLVVLGKSGQGKSVLIKCVIGMIEPDEGSIKLFNEEIIGIDEQKLREIRTKVGFLFQSGALYDSMTVRENLSFALTRVLHIKEEAEIEALTIEVLTAVGLGDAIDKMPSDLSGGMRKRLALARTLIVKPAIILYDEPTTGLDTITSKEISQLMLEVQKKYQTTSVIITHDISCAAITSNRIIILDNGAFIGEGSFEALSNSEVPFIQSFFK